MTCANIGVYNQQVKSYLPMVVNIVNLGVEGKFCIILHLTEEAVQGQLYSQTFLTCPVLS